MQPLWVPRNYLQKHRLLSILHLFMQSKKKYRCISFNTLTYLQYKYFNIVFVALGSNLRSINSHFIWIVNWQYFIGGHIMALQWPFNCKTMPILCPHNGTYVATSGIQVVAYQHNCGTMVVEQWQLVVQQWPFSGNIMANQLHKQISQLKSSYKAYASLTVGMWTHGVITRMKVIHQLQKSYSMCSLFLTVLTQLHITITMQFFKKSNIVEYMHKYGVYKLLYMKHMQNQSATIEQLVYFLM